MTATSQAVHGQVAEGFADVKRAFEQNFTQRDEKDIDQVLGPTAFSLGYLKPLPSCLFASPRACGTPGAGGSFGFTDPDTQLGFAYVMNKSNFYIWNDPDEVALRKATYSCIANL
ncbi:MAG: hypothetical protein DHS20C20_21150 [Ardenticatenaceae bacterium]|nr:MAG: hypothetical protein DHS20C20_21150 [Ardenticatenaceae bacterium]